MILHLGKREEKEYSLEPPFLRVSNNLHVSVQISHETRFVTSDDEVLNHFTKMSPQIPESSGVIILKKVQPLLLLI